MSESEGLVSLSPLLSSAVPLSNETLKCRVNRPKDGCAGGGRITTPPQLVPSVAALTSVWMAAENTPRTSPTLVHPGFTISVSDILPG